MVYFASPVIYMMSISTLPQLLHGLSDDTAEEPPTVLLLTLSTGGQGKLPSSEVVKCIKSGIQGHVGAGEQKCAIIRLPVSPAPGEEPGNIVLNLSTNFLGGEKGMKRHDGFLSFMKVGIHRIASPGRISLR